MHHNVNNWCHITRFIYKSTSSVNFYQSCLFSVSHPLLFECCIHLIQGVSLPIEPKLMKHFTRSGHTGPLRYYNCIAFDHRFDITITSPKPFPYYHPCILNFGLFLPAKYGRKPLNQSMGKTYQ